MAHEFVEHVRGVDIISDAENIKDLLKIPFNQKVKLPTLSSHIEVNGNLIRLHYNVKNIIVTSV